MPIWPFNLRRRKTINNDMPTTQPLTEKSQNLQQPPPMPVSQPSRTSSPKRKRRSRQKGHDKSEMIEDKNAGQENFEGGYKRRESLDEITALPVKWQLEHSPHLRPVDSERAQTPYKLQNHATSQTSIGKEGSSKAATLRSKRSTIDGSVSRRKSGKRRDEARLREEEIKVMSAMMPVPKRPSEGNPRRDSYKRRTFDGVKDSRVPIPPTMEVATVPEPKNAEHNGWEVQHFWINPRPAVRLSQTPAYTALDPVILTMPLARDISQKVKDKMPVYKETKRPHRTVGAEADTLEPCDLRAILERDAKRKEKRDVERQERLDRKLRAVERSRRSSTRSRAEVGRPPDEDIPPVPELRPGLNTARSSIHPALRDEPMFSDDEAVGLGIGAQATQGAEDLRENPFETPVPSPIYEEETLEADEPVETAFDDSVVQTAREVRMSTAITPPISPFDGRRRSSAIAVDAVPPRAAVSPPLPTTSTLSQFQPQGTKPEVKNNGRRAAGAGGAWSSFFRRGGTQREVPRQPMSFANTSRESMGRQPVPLHLVASRESPFQRSATGAPTRTQSKFREDLPDAPLSPPDSRVQSPDLPPNAVAIAAAAAAAAAAATAAYRPVEEDTSAGADVSPIEPTGVSTDTHTDPFREQNTMSASMASIDTEGSWLASGASVKRASAQSGLSRSFGSLTRPTHDFNASFEDLGEAGDQDAEYVQRGYEAQRNARAHGISSSPLTRASIEDDGPDPLAVHGSVRRKPTLVHSDPAARSREGLLSEFTAEEAGTSDLASKDYSTDEDDLAEAAQLVSARSIDYAVRHARQVSAGSAKLLDVAPRRMSVTPASPTFPVHQSDNNMKL